MRSEIRWTIVVVVLAVAGVIALWPLTRNPADPATGVAVPHLLDERSDITAPAPDDDQLAPLRQRAALGPCPSPEADAPAATGPLVGVAVPCLGAPGTVDLAAALAGRPALLNVWASWCAPCREEIPVLAAYAAQPAAVPVIGVNVQDRPAEALSLLADLAAGYPSVTDPDAALQAALQTPRILPTSYVLHPDGSVAGVNPPVVFRSPDQVRRTVERYLSEPDDGPGREHR